MKPQIPGHTWQQTEDQSWTLHSEKFNENCHSTTGANSETKKIYLEALAIKEKLIQRKKLNILEVGLGAGVSLFMTIDLYFNILKNSPETKLHYLSLEIDYELALFVSKELEKDFKLQIIDQNFYFNKDNCQIMIITGDARTRLPELKTDSAHLPFDVIYQDAFSPKNNPALWTQEWFTLLKNLSSPNMELSTYSASKRAQRAMYFAGLKVEVCPGFTGKNFHSKAYGPSHSFVMDKKLEENLKMNPHLALQDAHLVKS